MTLNGISALQAMAAEGHVAAPAQPRMDYLFKPMSLRDLLQMPPKQWLINQLIGLGDIVMIYGAPGSGKTFTVVDLIFAACTGDQWAKRFAVARPLNVAYCAGEGVSGLPARFGAAAMHYGLDDLPKFTFFPVTPSLYCEDGVKRDVESIERFVMEWQERQEHGEAQPLDILIIDTLHSATFGADENSAKDMGVVLGAIKNAVRALGCAVIIVHHSNKAGTGERGSSALRGAMDAMIEVKQVASKYAISCEKLKDGERWRDQTFDLVAQGESVRVFWDEPNAGENGDGRTTNTKQRILEFLAEHMDAHLKAKQIAEPLDLKAQATNNALVRLVDSGLVQRDLDASSNAIYSITQAGVESLDHKFTPGDLLRY